MERFCHVPPTLERNDYQTLRWSSSLAQRVNSQLTDVVLQSRPIMTEKTDCCTQQYSVVVADGFWAHIGSIFEASVAARGA